MTTIRRTLSLWLLGGMLISALIGSIASYSMSLSAADEMFDRHLAHIAVILPARIASQPEPPDNGNPLDNIFLQVWDARGQRTYPTVPSINIPAFDTTGYHNLVFQGEAWRVYTERQENRIVQVAQSIDTRRRLAAGLTLNTVLPFLALVPLLGGIIWYVVGQSAASMRQVAQEVELRSAQALDPIPTRQVPREIQPMIAALNDLLRRLDRSMISQRTFIADAAHELRSPLTALKLHLQLTERAQSDAERSLGFAKVRERLDRMSRLIEQLLRLAREEPRMLDQVAAPVGLEPLLQNVVNDHLPLAESRGIVISLATDGDSAASPMEVSGQEESLRVLFSNLIDNAVRYTNDNGRIDISFVTSSDEFSVLIDDDGPGILAAERERVFDRFHRIEGSGKIGSGLGLAIVRTIADRHHCSVTLHDRPGGHGLRVCVAFARPAVTIAAQPPERMFNFHDIS